MNQLNQCKISNMKHTVAESGFLSLLRLWMDHTGHMDQERCECARACVGGIFLHFSGALLTAQRCGK